MWMGIAIVAAAALGCFAWWWIRTIGDDSSDEYAANQLIVRFRDGTDAETIDGIHRKHRCEVVDELEELGIQVIRSKRRMKWMLGKYSKMGEIEYAEPNVMVKAFAVPNDPYFAGYQYGPQRIGAPAAWDVTQSRSDIVIAVLDSGAQLDHPDLFSKIVPGYDYISNDPIPQDGNGHGTHVAGIAAAATNNGQGIAGIAPLASIMPIRVLDNAGYGALATVARGILHAANAGAHVINLSLGTTVSNYSLQYAVNYAWNQGAVIVSAAGNDGVPTPNYPANYPNVIAVAATDALDQRAAFSNYGTWVETAAPGAAVLSTYLGSFYAYLDGTSMAAPHVAGLAALLTAMGRTNVEIRNIILSTCDPIPGTGALWQYGRINAERAVQAALAAAQPAQG